MGNVLEATAKKIRISHISKRWWNADIKATRNTVGRETRRRHNLEEAGGAKTALHTSISQSKRIRWSKDL
jgi:hypothetical protein